MRLARIAKAEDAARLAKKEAEAVKGELAELRAWKETRGKDPLAAATQGLSKEQKAALYWTLNDEILAEAGGQPQETEEQRVTRLVNERLAAAKKEQEEASGKAQQEARDAAGDAYLTDVAKTLSASPAKWPAVGLFGVSRGDIFAHVKEHYEKTGKTATEAEVLDHFEKQLQPRLEAAGYTRQKVEAPPGGEGTAKAANGTKTITNEWSAGAGGADADHAKLSRRKSSEEIKRRMLKS